MELPHTSLEGATKLAPEQREMDRDRWNGSPVGSKNYVLRSKVGRRFVRRFFVILMRQLLFCPPTRRLPL